MDRRATTPCGRPGLAGAHGRRRAGSRGGPLLDPGDRPAPRGSARRSLEGDGVTDRRPYWQNRPVLVTGASGLVGSQLVAALLASGADVAVLLRDRDLRSELFRSGNIGRVAVTEGELESLADVERAIAESGASVVFHLGAQTLVGVGLNASLVTLESNVRGTYNLLEASRRQSGTVERVVVASSDKAYGQSDRQYSEDDPLRASSPYDVSKAAGDLIARSYHATYGLRLGIVRCGNIYGGADPDSVRSLPRPTRSFLKPPASQIPTA